MSVATMTCGGRRVARSPIISSHASARHHKSSRADILWDGGFYGFRLSRLPKKPFTQGHEAATDGLSSRSRQPVAIPTLESETERIDQLATFDLVRDEAARHQGKALPTDR